MCAGGKALPEGMMGGVTTIYSLRVGHTYPRPSERHFGHAPRAAERCAIWDAGSTTPSVVHE